MTALGHVTDADAEESPYRGVQVHLEAFAGPLDLLLHLIQRDEIDVYDIPIAHITTQYLEHLELMSELDLEVAGEYLVMAATLIRIKSQMLLPTPAIDEDGEEIDPREELVRRLIEYRKFKTVAEQLREHELSRQRRHARQIEPPELAPDELPIGRVTAFDLVTHLKAVLARLDDVTTHEVELEPVHLEDRIELLRARLAGQRELTFTEYLRDVRSRMGVVVSFMAVLELMKAGEISAVQEHAFGEILILRRDGLGSDATA